MRLSFSTRKNKRIHLSELLLKPDSEPTQSTKAETMKTAEPSKGIRPRSSQKLLAMLLLAGTGTIVGVVVTKTTNSKHTTAIESSGETSISDRKKKMEAAPVLQLEQDKEFKATAGVQKVTRKLDTPHRQAPDLVADVPRGIVAGAMKTPEADTEDAPSIQTQYKINSKAPVYDAPVEGSHKEIIDWKRTYRPFNALSEQNGFVYAVISNNKHHIVEGWLRKSDLQPVKTSSSDGEVK